MSVFLGEQLSRILDQVESGAVVSSSERKTPDPGDSGAAVLAKDYTDPQPHARSDGFTGNKFQVPRRPAGQAITVPLR